MCRCGGGGRVHTRRRWFSVLSFVEVSSAAISVYFRFSFNRLKEKSLAGIEVTYGGGLMESSRSLGDWLIKLIKQFKFIKLSKLIKHAGIIL